MISPQNPVPIGAREVTSSVGLRTFTLGSDGSLWNLPGEAPFEWSTSWASAAPRTMHEACVAPVELMATARGGQVGHRQAHHVLGIVELTGGHRVREQADGRVHAEAGRLLGLWVNESTVHWSVLEALREAQQRQPVDQQVRWYALRSGLLREFGSRDRMPACAAGKPIVVQRGLQDSASASPSGIWQRRGPACLEAGWVRQIIDGEDGQSLVVGVVTDPHRDGAVRVKAQLASMVPRLRVSAAVMVGATGLVEAYSRRRLRGAWVSVPTRRVATTLGRLPCRWAPTMLGIGDLALASLADRDGPCSVEFEWPGGLPQGRCVEEQMVIEEAVALLSRRWYRQAKSVIAASGWTRVVEPAVPGPVPVLPAEVVRSGRASLAARADAAGVVARELVAAAAGEASSRCGR